MPKHKNGFVPIIILALILAILVAGAYVFKLKTPPPKACTLIAKICPDGSSVGRTGPNCEFAPCPNQQATDSAETSPEGKDCGGFAGETGDAACPAGYKCQYPQPMYPDATGKCVKR